ncbi:MAG: hypothetical protein ABR985_10555 [Methanotrichaceae archaeon]
MALFCLALQAYAQNPDQGLTSMENWLNQPDNYFPWYSTSSGSFYSQPYSDTTFSPFREYYTTSGTPVVGGIISNPTTFDIAQRTPSTIYYGNGQALPYTQYVSTVPSKTNDLWIQGATNWTQYVVSPVGTWLQLVANAPVGGAAGFYEMIQTSTTSSKYNTYQFNSGYNTMNFYADQVGRHTLYFVVNNQPSNVVVVDVFAQAQPGTGTGGVVPIAGQNQPIVLGGNTPPSNYLPASTIYYPGYINPYNSNPQAALDLAVANHAYQKSLTNYYNSYYGTYQYPYSVGA